MIKLFNQVTQKINQAPPMMMKKRRNINNNRVKAMPTTENVKWQKAIFLHTFSKFLSLSTCCVKKQK